MKGPEFTHTHIIEEGVENSIRNSVQNLMKQNPITATTDTIAPNHLQEALKSSITTKVNLSDLGNLIISLERRCEIYEI